MPAKQHSNAFIVLDIREAPAAVFLVTLVRVNVAAPIKYGAKRGNTTLLCNPPYVHMLKCHDIEP